MTEQMLLEANVTLDDEVWGEIDLPPTDLPYDDGDKMESPWHVGNAFLIKASYAVVRGSSPKDYFVGINMFLYYSMNQVRNRDYRGPDVFIVKNVDSSRDRKSWIVWEEQGRYPDVIFELLSPSTERTDMVGKKWLYEHTFKTAEYFCVAPNVERLLGWRYNGNAYVPIEPDKRGWLWSEQIGMWLGPWTGTYALDTYTWLRFYTLDGELVRLPDEEAEERVQDAREQVQVAEERARQAEGQARQARERAERLEALLREKGIDPETI